MASKTAGLNDMTQNSSDPQNGSTPPSPPSGPFNANYDTSIGDAPTTPSPALSYYRPPVSSTNPLMALLHAVSGGRLNQLGSPVMSTNVNPNSDMTKQLGLPDIAPIGKDNQGNPLFDYAESTKRNEDIASFQKMKVLRGMTNPTFSSDEELSNASGKLIDIPTAHQMRTDYANTHGGADFPMSELKTAMTGAGTKSRADVGKAMVGVKQNMVDILQQRLDAQTLGPQARQASMSDAQGRMNNIERFYGIYDRIQSAGFQATKLERSLANTEVARVIAGSGGVLTDEGFNRVAQESGMQKGGNLVSWITNDATPVQFKSFLDNAKGLMDNEYVINAGLFRKAQLDNARQLHRPTPQAASTSGMLPNVPRPGLTPDSSFPAPNQTPPKAVNMNGRVTMTKPDGSIVAVAAKDVIRARAKGYTVK